MTVTQTTFLSEVTDRLADNDFTVAPHRWPHMMSIANAHGQGTVQADHSHGVHLFWQPHEPDARIATDTAALLLTGQPAAHHPPADTPPGPFMRETGFALKDNGFHVELCAHVDDVGLDVFADVAITLPGDTTGATVYVCSDGGITWCQNQPPRPADPADVANHLTVALSAIVQEPSAAISDRTSRPAPVVPGQDWPTGVLPLDQDGTR